MSSTVCIDTALLAIPNYASDPDEAEQVILRLSRWADTVVRLGSDRIVRSELAEEELGALGFFPGLKNVADLIEFNDLSEVYDAKTVWSSYNTILNRAGLLSDVVGHEVTRTSSVTIDPPVLNGCTPSTLKSISERLLSSLASSNRDLEPPNHFLASPFSGSGDLSISCNIDEVSGKIPEWIKSIPVFIDGKVHLLDKLEEILSTTGAVDLWARARTNSDLYFSILGRALEISTATKPGIEWTEIPTFVIGSEFCASLKRNGCYGDGPYSGIVLDACARAVVGLPKDPLNPFGKPDQVRRARDNAPALRTHLTGKGVGLRLMLWQHQSGKLELANVGPKHELEIEAGDPALAYQLSPTR